MERWSRLGLGAAAIAIIGLLTLAATWNASASPAPASAALKVEMAAGRNENSIVYSITLANEGTSPAANIYLAGLIPKGTQFEGVEASPPGSTGGRVEGEVVYWLSGGVAPKGKQGPFSFRVKATAPQVGPSHAWVRWLLPSEGTAASAQVSADYQLIKLRGVNTRVDHEKLPAGQVAMTTTSGKGHGEDEIVASGLPNVGVGDYVYLQGADHDALENKLVQWAWQLREKPLGSQARLEKADTQTPRFRTDRVGQYVVQVAATNEKGEVSGSTMTIYAGRYAGVALCASCHNGTLAEDIVSKWAQTGHATKFETSYAGYTPERDYCIRCHTVGYDETANSGGMDDMARASGWNPARDGSVLAWLKKAGKTLEDVKADPNLSLMINVQCESCHGPGGSAHTQAKSYNPAVCGQCHPQPAAWKYSKHAVVDPHTATNPACARCHTGQGYTEGNIRGQSAIFPDAAASGKPANIPSLEQQSGIACASCHDPHAFTYPFKVGEEEKSYQLRVQGRVTAPNGWSVDAGVAATCVSCHANNRTQTVMSQYLAGAYPRATHENTQADVFFGQGYYGYGGAIKVTNSAHTTVAKCVSCHMAAQPAVAPGPDGQWGTSDDVKALSVGGHSFNMEAEWEGKEVENTGACTACHPGLSTLNRPAFADYDGNGKIEGLQDEVKGLLKVLAEKLPKDAQGQVIAYPISNANTTEAQRKAMWNYFLILRDGSYGIHNAPFTVQLLQQSYKQLTGSEVPGATRR